MSPRPIRTIPSYIRTGNRGSRDFVPGAPGFTPVRGEALREVVETAPTLTSLMLKSIFGTVADREAATVIEDYSSQIGQAIDRDLFAGVLFEVAVYKHRDTGGFGTYQLKLVRPGDNPQDALERDYAILAAQGPSMSAGRPDERVYRYSNSESYFVYVSKDTDSGNFVAEKITNPQMLRNVAKSNVILGVGVDARRIQDSERIVQKYRSILDRARLRDEQDLVRIQIENLANARISLENRLLEARSLLQQAQEERERASFFNEVSAGLSVISSGLKLTGSILDGLPDTETTGEAFEYQYEPTFDLEFDIDPTLNPIPSLEQNIENLQIEADRIDIILG